jgi:hypothetical protein
VAVQDRDSHRLILQVSKIKGHKSKNSASSSQSVQSEANGSKA